MSVPPAVQSSCWELMWVEVWTSLNISSWFVEYWFETSCLAWWLLDVRVVVQRISWLNKKRLKYVYLPSVTNTQMSCSHISKLGRSGWNHKLMRKLLKKWEKGSFSHKFPYSQIYFLLLAVIKTEGTSVFFFIVNRFSDLTEQPQIQQNVSLSDLTYTILIVFQSGKMKH